MTSGSLGLPALLPERRWWSACLPLCLAIGMLPGSALAQRMFAPASPAATVEDPDDARVIVKYRAGAALLAAAPKRPQHAGRLGRRLALSLSDGWMLGTRIQGLHGRGLSSRALAARLAAQPDVEWAVVDERRAISAVLPNDPYFGANQTAITPAVGQWYLRAPDATALSATNALGAWAVNLGSPSITVAVVDTGVRYDHPDLAGKLWAGYDFVRASISNDGDGTDADASDPGDYSVASDSCGAHDSSWHGTQVAGLIAAATDNGRGMAGLGRNVMVLPVRVLGKCGGFDSDIIAGLRWAAGRSSDPVRNDHPAQVVNLSLGSSGPCTAAYRDVVNELVGAGVTVVVAAGNDTGHAVNTPANCGGAIAVAGVRHAGTKVGYSNIGPEIALAAPAGNCVNETSGSPCLYPLLTTVNAGTTTPGANIYSDSSRTSLGTSFSAPLVAGTVALMLSQQPSLKPAEVKAALQATARPFPTVGSQANGSIACAAPTALDQLECYCTASTCGAGLLDAGAALARVAATASPPLAVFAIADSAPTVGSTVALDGTPSSASAVSYQWALGVGTGAASFTGSTQSPTARLTVSAPGSVVVNLTVTNASGASQTTSHTLTATLAPAAAMVVSNPTPTVGAAVTLDGRGAAASTGRSVAGYQWAIVPPSSAAHFVGAASGSTASTATIVADQPGSLTVSLTVTDNLGASRSSSQTLQVGAAPAASVSVSDPQPAAGGSVTLDGSGSSAAAGHRVAGYQWSITSGGSFAALSGAVNGPSVVLATSAAGTVTVSLRVTDDAGSTATTSTTISVAPARSGGGGAVGIGWSIGLALAVLALWRRRGSAAVT